MDLSVAIIAAGAALDGSVTGPMAPPWRSSVGLAAAKIVKRLHAVRARHSEPSGGTRPPS